MQDHVVAERDEDKVRFCKDGGIIGGTVVRIPADPWIREAPGAFTEIGCSRLRCTDCGAMVRHRERVCCRAGTEPDPRELCAVEPSQWCRLPYVERCREGRLYVCRCTIWLDTATHSLVVPDPDPDDPVLPPWRCAGHPLPPSRITVDGVVLGPETDMVELVDGVIGGWRPSRALAMYQVRWPAWLCRLHGEIAGSAAGDAFARAMARHLGSADPAATGAALYFFERFPHAPGVSGVLELTARALETGLELCYKAPGSREPENPLRVLAARLSAHRQPADERETSARELLRRALTTPSRLAVTEDVMRAAARDDPRWLAEHVAEVLAVRPQGWIMLLEALEDARAPMELQHVAGMSMLTLGLVEPKALLRWARKPWRPSPQGSLLAEAARDALTGSKRSGGRSDERRPAPVTGDPDVLAIVRPARPHRRRPLVDGHL